MPADLFPDPPYDYAAVAPPGSTLFTAGACPLDVNGVVTEPRDLAAQAHRCVDNLVAVLERYGASVGDLVRTTVYVVGDPDDLVTVWDVVAARLAPHRPPSTLLGVACLGYPDQLIEIDAIATLPTTTPSGN